MNPDKVPAGERCASTSNRNFVGRQGPGAAALMYAGRHQMKKHDDFKPVKDKPLPKYENEPDYDDGEDYGEEE